MRAVDRIREGAIGKRAGVIAHLPQAFEAQVANAREVVRRQVRLGDDFLHERQSRLEEPVERRQADDHGIETRIEIEVPADARDAVRDLECRLAAAALVEQARGDRHQPVCICRIDRRSPGHQQHHRHDRH